MWGSASNDVYAVARTALYHYNGTSWSQGTAVPGGYDVFGTAANDVYVGNHTDLWHYDGTTWTKKVSPSEVAHGWANSPTDVWLGGNNKLGHYDGTFFSVPVTTGFINSIVGTATEMYVLGDADVRVWTGGFGTTPTTLPLLPGFGTGVGWRSPAGKFYMAGHGLLLRE